ncbi:MAG: hypothetical protein QOI80_1116 [Solirubrobacteraceae bacterium]|nr:hypothetical protein [Solirubrobacteraceae bacterium]
MSASVLGLVDREAEIARVRAGADGAAHGRGAVLAIEGEPGIGKTALLDAAMEAAADAEVAVLSARASELERGYPFGVVRQLFERAVAGRADLFVGRAALAAAVLDAPAGDAASTASEGTLHGLYWLLVNLQDEEPRLLAIDDLQWADDESLAFLRFLSVRLAGLRVAAVITTRPAVSDGPAADLLVDPAVELVRPRALGPDGAAAFLTQRLGQAPDPAFAAACHAVTGGNPFLLDQLVQALRAEAIEPTGEQAARVGQLRPDGLARSVIAKLDEDARDLARCLAILGDGVEVSAAAELAGLEPDRAEAPADALAAAGLIADERPLRFRHALLRGAVLAGMRAGERVQWHTVAVALLRERGAAPEQICAHLLRLEPRADPDDAATLREAADQARARGAPATAAQLLERALAEPLTDDERAEVLIALGTAELALGRASAFERCREAARIASDGARRIAAAVVAGRAAGLDPANAAPALELLASIDAGDDRAAAMEIVNAELTSTWSNIERWHAVLSRVAALEPITGETATECMVLAHLARGGLESGVPAVEVAAIAERAMRHEVFVETAWIVPVLVSLAAVDRHATAEALAERAIDHARKHGTLRSFHIASIWQARVAHMRGDLERAEELAHTAIDAVADTPTWWALIPVSTLVETLVDQGRDADAAQAWSAAGLGEDVPRHRALNQLLHARARLRQSQGDLAGALDDLREIDRRAGPITRRSINWIDTRLRTAEILDLLGDREGALAESEAAVELTRSFGAASSLGAALRIHGRLTGDEALVAEAVELLRGAPTRLIFARALIDLGASMRRRHARRESREPLREAHALALACGALPDAEHARLELAASGVTVRRADPSRRDELTPSERRIAGMAAEGASNKDIAQALFLTVKTVEMHLSSTYRKLDVRSRRDLPEALARPEGGAR